MLNQTEKKPHVHCDLIKAWADGAEIQVYSYSTWEDVPNNKPNWSIDSQYRIKPEVTDAERYGVEVGDVWYIPYFKRLLAVWDIGTNNLYSGGKLIKTLDETKISYEMFIEDKCELMFRKGVLNLL